MPLINTLLDYPIKLIKKYIEENQKFTQENQSMSFRQSLMFGVHKLLGQNITLTGYKVEAATKFIGLLEKILSNNDDELRTQFSRTLTADPEALTVIDISKKLENQLSELLKKQLSEIRTKINLEKQSIETIRGVQNNTQKGSYDAILIVFSNCVSFMLDRLSYTAYILNLESTQPDDNKTKVLLYLEEALFKIMLNQFLQEQSAILSEPVKFVHAHAESSAKILADTIRMMRTIVIVDHNNQEDLNIIQLDYLSIILSGLLSKLALMEQSVGIQEIVEDITKLNRAIEEQKTNYEQAQKHKQLYGSETSSDLAIEPFEEIEGDLLTENPILQGCDIKLSVLPQVELKDKEPILSQVEIKEPDPLPTSAEQVATLQVESKDPGDPRHSDPLSQVESKETDPCTASSSSASSTLSRTLLLSSQAHTSSSVFQYGQQTIMDAANFSINKNNKWSKPQKKIT